MSWTHQELSSLDLGDVRRNERAKRMVERMAERPSGSIPQTFQTDAETKAAYRALSSEAFDPEALRSALRDATVSRIEETQFVLAVQDTTSFNYTGHPATEGTGPLARPDQVGFLVHSVLAVSAEGVPLGLLQQKVWARDPGTVGQRHRRKQRPVEEKESFRWIESLRAVHEAVPAGVTVLSVADREADIFELFAEGRPTNSELLIRACRNRRVATPQRYLWDAVAAVAETDSWQVSLRRHPNRAARDAQLTLRFREVTLRPPGGGVHSTDLKPVTVTAILVREDVPPEGETPIEWLLLTTLEVPDAEHARRIIGFYGLRWLIERYHFVLKSGCGIEESQLRSVERLECLLALYCVVAWRLLWLTYAARQDPEAPCTVAFTDLEWQTAYRVRHRDRPLPDQPPTLGELIRWIAGLGGFLGRRGDRQPGVKALWRGLMRLNDIILGLTLNNSELVGNA
jgi:hypothetical protein